MRKCSVLAVVIMAASVVCGAVIAQTPPQTTARVPEANNTWTGQNAVSPPVALTDGATIAVNAAGPGNYTLTLAGAGHALACPTGLTTGVQYLSIDVTQGSGGPYGLSAAGTGCYLLPSGTIPLTQTAAAMDTLTFKCVASVCRLGGIAANLQTPKTFTYLGGKIGSGALPASASTVSMTFGFTAAIGSNVLCAVVQGSGGGTAAPTSVVSGSVSLTNIASQTGASPIMRIYAAYGITSAVTTVTATWAAAVSFPQVGCDAFTGGTVSDGSNVAALTNPGTGADAVASGSLSPTAPPDFAWGVAVQNSGSATITVGTATPWILGSRDATAGNWSMVTEYQTLSGTTAVAATFGSSAGAADAYSAGLALTR